MRTYLPVTYRGRRLQSLGRVDTIVDDLVVVELKAVEQLGLVHRAQLLGYLRLSGCQVGLLLNFNVPLMKDGIVRVVRT